MIGLHVDYQILFALLVGHAIADFSQGDFMVKAKNPFAPVEGVPWFWVMGAHALIHGGMVFLVTGSVMLGLAETWCHAVIDVGKCKGIISFNEDQGWHIACKFVWTAFALIGGMP